MGHKLVCNFGDCISCDMMSRSVCFWKPSLAVSSRTRSTCFPCLASNAFDSSATAILQRGCHKTRTDRSILMLGYAWLNCRQCPSWPPAPKAQNPRRRQACGSRGQPGKATRLGPTQRRLVGAAWRQCSRKGCPGDVEIRTDPKSSASNQSLSTGAEYFPRRLWWQHVEATLQTSLLWMSRKAPSSVVLTLSHLLSAALNLARAHLFCAECTPASDQAIFNS